MVVVDKRDLKMSENFLTRLKKFISWKLDEISRMLNLNLTKLSNLIIRVEKGSFKQRHTEMFFYCLIEYPVKRIKKMLNLVNNVEDHYDEISGSYVADLTVNNRKKWGVVDGEPQKNTYANHCVDGMKERMQIMEGSGPYNNMLEVGAGELTTFCSLVDVMTHVQPDLYAIDLSLNRLRHGRAYANSKSIDVNLAKASAFALPYPDNSFDVVFTSHCLEWMPKKMFKQAVDEVCRVSRKHVFLFEPTYEYSSFLQKMKMRTHSYMRGLVPYLQQKKGIKIRYSAIMKHSYNVFNETSCHHLVVENDDSTPLVEKDVALACPSCKEVLELNENSYFCFTCCRGYPVFDGIPVLDSDYSLGVNRIEQ